MKPSDAMNCDNRSATGGCGPVGHSLDHHTAIAASDGSIYKLSCSYCGSTCPVKPYPKHLHLVPEAAKVMLDVSKEFVEKDPKTKQLVKVMRTVKVEKVGYYYCSNCKTEVTASHHADTCPISQISHVNCHLWSKW